MTSEDRRIPFAKPPLRRFDFDAHALRGSDFYGSILRYRAEMLQRHRVRQLFASPALLDRVGRFGERHGISLPDLRRVVSAGAPVPARTLARFSKMLSPGVEIFTPYGATEALPVALITTPASARMLVVR